MDNKRISGSLYARSLIEASRDPLFTINPEGKITDINNASINITEVTRENLIGTDFFEYFTDPAKAREIYKQVFSEGFVADFPLTIRDGKLTDVLFNGSVYKDESGKVMGVVVVARDITDHKRIEKELLEAKENSEKAAKIACEAKSKAEESTRIAENALISKQQFLSNMSHEIRTPLNSIIGFTKVLLKTELTTKQNEYLMAIKMSGEVLTELVNDILDLAKVDAGKMVFDQKPFNMKASIFAIVQLFEPKILEKNLKLIKKYDDSIPNILIGDPVRLNQILINLLSNAVKFTHKGRINMEIRLLKEDIDKVFVEFAIKDTGIGIADENISHIFENFQQATNNISRLYGGTGLGLAITKQLTIQQGGTITVISKIDIGTTFKVVIPFLKTNTNLEITTEIKKLNINRNQKVLVVEDIILNQLLLKTFIDDFGFECDFAGNGNIAIEKLRSKRYDIILMDLQMPEMNGFEATKYIRGKMNLKIPIIALTADVTTADLKKCIAMGMNDYISKPVDEELLYGKIVELLKNSELDIDKDLPANSSKLTDLHYLNERTKGDTRLMMEMIRLFLEQTPSLISSMKQSLADKDWNTLYTAVHKIIPSFYIISINKKFENIAKKIQEYASNMEHLDELPELVLQLEYGCSQALMELKESYDILNSGNK